jgi:ADP-ribose pyrophosphatase YjhB (NUDIX family)
MTRSGAWCIPCGYLEYGEEASDGAARELREETGLEAAIGPPVFVRTNFHDPAKVTVGIWFEGTVTGGVLGPGDDAVEADWFPLDGLPELAFPTDAALLATLA